jgi:DNA-binding SARP family transcriptional activator
MLTDVFGDRPTEQARGYLHVIRHALTRAVPTLDVTYDRQERQYRLYSGTARVRCDAQEVLRATRLGGEFGLARALAWYRGPFLPNTETEWAQAWRQKLIEAVRRLGLDYLELLARKGRFDACLSYAEQLRALNPLDEQVNTLVVEACRACDGKVVARQALRSIISEYRREVGDVPPYLDALALRIGL